MILFASYSDYSNLCFNFSQSLKAVGVESDCLNLIPHEYAYATQGRVVTIEEMSDAMLQADHIIIGHSSPFIFNLCKYSGKLLYPLHTGTIYRRNPTKFNTLYNRYCDKTLTDSPEFYHLGANNIVYISAAIDTEEIQMIPDTNTEITFGHFPSKGGFKGTEKIKEMMASMPQVKFVCDETIVPHEENLKRIASTSVYIEMFSPSQEGNEYGSWGVTASEAAALGRIVITNALHRDVYEQAYGELPFFIANTEDQFKASVLTLHNMPSLVKNIQSAHRKWVEEKHSFMATGYCLKKIFGERSHRNKTNLRIL
jgi:hypothetical protein